MSLIRLSQIKGGKQITKTLSDLKSSQIKYAKLDITTLSSTVDEFDEEIVELNPYLLGDIKVGPVLTRLEVNGVTYYENDEYIIDRINSALYWDSSISFDMPKDAKVVLAYASELSEEDSEPPVTEPEVPTMTTNDFLHYNNTEGEVIKKYVGTQSRVAVPYTLAESPVVEIEPQAFKDTTLTHIEIEAAQQTLIENVDLEGITVVTVPLEPNPEGDFTFMTYDGQTQVNGYTGTRTDVVIPETLGGAPVTSISGNTFASKGLTTVVMPDTINYIGSGAFKDNELTSVKFPESLETISADAFRNNNLTTLDLPIATTSVSNGAFVDNPVTEVSANSQVHYYAFSNTTGHKAFSQPYPTMTVNQGFTYEIVDDHVEITGFIGEPTERIEVFPEYLGVPTTKVRSNVLTDKPVVTQLTLNSVKEVEAYAFANNSIDSVSMDKLEVIGEGAFENNQIQYFHLSTNLVSVGNKAFKNNKITRITLPTFEDLAKVKTETIGDEAFMGNRIMQVYEGNASVGATLQLPVTITSIGRSAFEGHDISNFKLPMLLTQLGDRAFYSHPDRPKVYGISAPPAIKSLLEADKARYANGDYSIGTLITPGYLFDTMSDGAGGEIITAYRGANKFSEVVIPNYGIRYSGMITGIGSGAFNNAGLTHLDLTLATSLKTYGSDSFANNQLSGTLYIPNFTTLNNRAFSYNNYSKVIIGSGSETGIGSNIFVGNPITEVSAGAYLRTALMSAANANFSDPQPQFV